MKFKKCLLCGPLAYQDLELVAMANSQLLQNSQLQGTIEVISRKWLWNTGCLHRNHEGFSKTVIKNY